MKTRVQKWGNSLALRIPKAFADEVGIADNGLVEIMLRDGTLTVIPIPPPAVTLAELLRAVTDQNRHHEVDTGPAHGTELW
jgi:antitoxin MazE